MFRNTLRIAILCRCELVDMTGTNAGLLMCDQANQRGGQSVLTGLSTSILVYMFFGLSIVSSNLNKMKSEC